MGREINRRTFLHSAGLGGAAMGGMLTGGVALAAEGVKNIQGFEEAEVVDAHQGWEPVSDRKIRVGIAGWGVCQFGSAFGFQDHPNVEVVAVTDLFADRRESLAKECRCGKTYDSLEEMVQDDSIEAVFLATDAPSHARHALEALKHGKHVATCVPAIWGTLEEADALYEAVTKSGLTYMMFETTTFQEDCYAMRQLYQAGTLGKLMYSEGEYFHFMATPLDSYKGWRVGNPPQWYPTHSNAYYVSVTDGSFTEVSCQGMPSVLDYLKPGNNPYKNPFGTEIALFRTSEGGMSRMGVSWDTPGAEGVMGRVRGQSGSFYGKCEGLPADTPLPNMKRPPLPPTVDPGAHNGSHGYLTDEFIMAILQERKPIVDVVAALNLTVPGIVAHSSALKDGETMKIPQYGGAGKPA